MTRGWLLLLLRLARVPAALRLRTWRQLRSAGAVAFSHSTYALPDRPATRAELERIAAGIVAHDGVAAVAAARLVAGLSDAAVVARFDAARAADYQRVVRELPAVPAGTRLAGPQRAAVSAAIARARRRIEEIRAIDFFGGAERERAIAAVRALEHRLIPAAEAPQRLPAPDDLAGRIWVTRRDLHVDRLACAWLIRRFIDREARLRFVRGFTYRPRKRELRFDMADAEFTHDGDRCSFETFLERLALADPALQRIAELVHDLDLGDAKFSRPELPGVRRLVDGIVATHAGDLDRLASASSLFDQLYASYRHSRASEAASPRRGRPTPRARR